MTKFIYKSKKIISFLLVLLIFFSNTFSHASVSLVAGTSLATKVLSTISLSIGATYYTSELLDKCNLTLYDCNDTIKSIVDNVNTNYEYNSSGNVALKEGASGIDGSKIENGILYVPYNSAFRNSARETIRENFNITSRLVATNSAEKYIINTYYNDSTGLYNGYKYAYYLVANCKVTNRDYNQILFVALTDRPDFVFYCYDSGYNTIYPCYYSSSLYPCAVSSVYSPGSTDEFTVHNWSSTSTSAGCANYQGTFTSFSDILSCNTSVVDTGCVGYNDSMNNFRTPFSEVLKTETLDNIASISLGTTLDTGYPDINEDEEEDESIDWIPVPPEDYSIDNYTGKTYDELIKDIDDIYGNTSEDTETDTPSEDTSDKVIDETDYSIPESVTLDFSPLMLVGSTLTEKFPFCLPWDLYNCFSNLQAEETVPKFEVNFDEEYFVGGGTLTLDFEVFEPLVDIVHWGTLVLFVISLIFATKKIIGGGS